MKFNKFLYLLFTNILVGIFISIFLILSEKLNIIIKYDNYNPICINNNYDWNEFNYCS